MGASPSDRKMQAAAVLEAPKSRSKAAALRRAGYAESTIRHQTKRTYARLAKAGFAETLLDAGVTPEVVAEKIKELLEGGDPRASLGVIRLWLELHDLLSWDMERAVNVLVQLHVVAAERFVRPEDRADFLGFFAERLAP